MLLTAQGRAQSRAPQGNVNRAQEGPGGPWRPCPGVVLAVRMQWLAGPLAQTTRMQPDPSPGYTGDDLTMRAQDTIEQAEAALRGGRGEEALSLARQALAGGAPRAACLRVIGAAASMLGRSAEAVAALNELVELRPDDPWGYTELARLHLSAGQLAKAEALLQRAVELAPHDAALRADLHRVRQMRRRPRAGRRAVVVALALCALAALVALAVWMMGLSPGSDHRRMQAAAPPVTRSPAVTRTTPQRPAAPPVSRAMPPGAAQPPVTRATPAQPARPPVTEAAPAQPARPRMTQPTPQAPAQARITQPAPRSSASQPITQPGPQAPAQPRMTAAPPPLPAQPPVTQARPVGPPPEPPPPPPPPKEPRARILWLRCRELPELEVRAEGYVRRVYQMWGELLNESEQVLPVAVVRGVLLYNNQAAGYGLQEVNNVAPMGRAAFNFYCYQLALEAAPKPNNYDAMVIPGYSLADAFKQLGSYGAVLQEILRGTGLW